MNTIYEFYIDPGNGDPCEDPTYIEAATEENAVTYANTKDHCWPITKPTQHPTIRVECADGRPAYRLLLFPPESSKDQAIISLVEERAGLQWELNSTRRDLESTKNLARGQSATIASVPWADIDKIVSANVADIEDDDVVAAFDNVRTWLKGKA